MSISYEERSKHACKVCGNIPDEDGVLEHGRGCYVESSDGGGQSFVDFVDQTDKPTAEQQARDMLDRLGVEDAQTYSSGDLVELANLIAEVDMLRKKTE